MSFNKDLIKKWLTDPQFLLITFFFFVVFIASTATSFPGVVKGFYWKRALLIEEYRAIQDSGWHCPYDAYHVSSYRRLHHYDDIYETQRTVDSRGNRTSRRVKVGSEPVYRPYYEYTVDRWVYTYTLETFGTEKFGLYWPSFTPTVGSLRNLGATRIGSKKESLSLLVVWSTDKEQQKNQFFSIDSFDNVVVGDQVKVHYLMGIPTGISPEPKAEAN